MEKIISYICHVLVISLFFGCASVPEGLQPITQFQVDRYLGKWYEIARLDHSFERGLSKVTAEYSIMPDGKVQVINRGYDSKRSKWRETRGVAHFVGPKDVASLKVTFFWPFAGDYNVIAIDREGYDYAIVTGPSRSYLWILARENKLEPVILEDLLHKAKDWGFEVQDLIFIEQ